MRIDLCTAVFTASVNGDNNALAPKSFRCFLHEFRGIDGGGVQRYFIRAAAQYFLDVVDIAQAASHRERDIDGVGNTADHLCHDIPAIGRSGDVEKDEFISALF